jgi:hypothetical protein
MSQRQICTLAGNCNQKTEKITNFAQFADFGGGVVPLLKDQCLGPRIEKMV